MSDDRKRSRALQMLVLATAFWGLSFPATKALELAQQELLPGGSSWFVASLSIVYRFGIAALVLLLLSARTLARFSRLELQQGLGLGLFGGAGILLQVDGMTYTAASTSAFLTQCYCLLIPLWVAWRERQRPSAKVFASCAMVIVGAAVLARVEWRNLRIGRGEWETIAASVIFTGQILWLERPKYAANQVIHFSFVMFGVMALVCLPVALLTAQRPEDWLRAYASVPTLGFLAILVVFCTFGGYMLMNRWQRHVTATQAGLIYCIEPIFASLFALFLPAWFSAWAQLDYANETLTGQLLLGGGLITAANVLIYSPAATLKRPQTGPADPSAADREANRIAG
jgi:drug/metabolite transporter (DMT)-like permease